MATLTPLHAASPLDASDDVRLIFTNDASPETLSRALDDTEATFLTMDSPFTWTVEYRQQGRVDDTLSLGIRIVNGTTILAAANSTGDFHIVNSNIGNTTDQQLTRDFTYVNTTADKATWDGATVELQQTINRSMGADGCHIEVDWVEFTGTFTPSVTTSQIVHTTDISVGTFVVHTTDILVSEFAGPTDTMPGVSWTTSGAHKMAFSDDNQLWMVGVDLDATPQIVRLWQGTSHGPGFWQLHEFDHGSGNIRDVGLAIIGDNVHVVYVNHSGSTQRAFHIVWSISGETWTNKGGVGIAESHSDSTVSVNAKLDLIPTSDDELILVTVLYNYVSFAGSTAFRTRARLFKSSSETLPTSGGVLFREWYGPNTFDRPSFASPTLHPSGTSALVFEGDNAYSFFDGSTVSKFYPNVIESRSLPILIASGDQGGLTQIHTPKTRGGKHVWLIQARNTRGISYIAADDESGNELLFDQGEFMAKYLDLAPSGSGDVPYLLEDDHDRLGVAVVAATDDKVIIYTSNGLNKWFPHLHEIAVANRPHYRSSDIVERSYSAWDWTNSGPWAWIGTGIPSWYVAHSTDLVVSNAPLVSHTTDLVVSSGMWGFVDTQFQNPRLSWFGYNNKHYIITRAVRGGDILYVFEATSPRNPGSLVTTWHYEDLTANPVGQTDSDYVHVDGVIHFLFMVWVNNRREAHHSEYDIDTDTWTHHGSFHNGTTAHQDTGGPASITQRSNGDLIALYQFGSPGGGLHYSINTGTGFSTGTSLERTTGFRRSGIAVDGNDVHFLVYEGTNLQHWHLSPTNVLGARQQISNSPGSFYQTSKPLVHNGTMFIASYASGTTVVVHRAATGSDAPTWTTDTISTGIDRIGGFMQGPDGLPTLFYVKQGTWKIMKARYDGGWIEADTGQTLNVVDSDHASGELHNVAARHIYASETLDADNYAYFWWMVNRRPAGEEPSESRWYPQKVNLNPVVVHTTDVITVEGSQVVVHTTNVIVSDQQAREHTTDIITSALAEAAVTHTADLRTVLRPTNVHTTDVRAAFLATLTHTTDLIVVNTPHDLSVTIILPFDLTVTLEQGNKPAATGLGIPRQGVQAPRIYNPRHRVVKR